MENQKLHVVLFLAISITLIHASPLSGDALSFDIPVTTLALANDTATSNSLPSRSTSRTQPTLVKAMVTCLAGVAIVLVAATHWLLTASSGSLLTGFYLPR